jgi:hypothetical protein
VIIQMFGNVTANALGAEEGAYMAGRHEQCFTGGVWRARIFTCPNAFRGEGPLCSSSVQSPLSRELPARRLTTGTTRAPEVTRRQAVRTRPADYACPAAPTANLR